MTRDEAIDIVRNFEFIKAFAAGADIEYNPMPSKNPDWWIVEDPNFDNAKECYRIKPEPEKAPMTFEDFKNFPIVWVRNKCYPLDTHQLVSCFDREWLSAGGRNYTYTYVDLFRGGMLWSTDRVNWHKFEKEI